MDDDVREWHLAHELDPGHDHAAHPEVDDLSSGAVHVRRVKGLEVFGVVGPAEGGKRPQSRRKPRVEDVGILDQTRASALKTLAWRIHRHDHVAVVAAVDRHAMAEP